jgi:O-antigen/teichoic acid export membrane protein
MFLAALLVPTCIGIAVSSREIVLVVLGEKWTAAIPVLQILALATPFNLLSVLGGIVCEATATLKPKTLIQVAHLGLLLTLFYFARGLGITGFAMAVVIAETTRHALYVLLTRQMFKIDVREIFRSYQPAFFSALVAGISIYGLASFLRHLGLPIGFVMAAEVFLGITILILSVFSPPQRAMRQEIQMRFFGPGGVVDRNTMSGRMLGRFERVFLVKGR